MPFPRLVFPRFVAVLVTLAFVSPLTLTAAETPITTPAPAPAPIATPATNPATTPPAPTAEIQAVAADLLKALPQVACLVERDGNALWTGSKDLSFKVASLDKNGNPLVETAIGRLAIDRRLLADNRSDAADALPRLIEHAKAANLTGDGFMLREGVLTGLHLFSSQVRVLDEGVVRKVEVPTDERNADRERVIAASELLIKAMARTDLDDLGKKTLEDVLHRTAQEDGNQEVDEVFPSFARRVIRAGWLRQFFAKDDAAAVANLEQLVTKAEQFQPVTLFTGPGLKLAEVRDAFNRGGRWLLSTPSRAAYVQPHESPLYYWAMSEPGPTLVVDLPGGADPAVPNDGPVGARIYQDQQLLVSWSKDKGLVANKDEWRKAIPARGRKGIEPNAVADFMPPHILITALNGDIMRLVTVTGQLVPPKNGSTQEVERFLAESAKALPDPAHLDLIGEYIFAYVYDSPDSRYPYLIGNKGVKGDIHQTAAQTIATATGGMIRGDCDDLSELYQTIAERQGRTAHVVSLPQHAAMAFAEKKEDGNWHSYVLQTGPPLEFIDAKLPLALEKAYKHFNENDAFDPNGLGLLLRFSGENTRGQWRLSWRIFSEPEYAKTMIDVQRDWHFQTYQRGIAKMKKLIADGDNDNANFRELSGLFGFTGQYGLAVEYHDEAIKRTPDPEGRLGLSIELVQHLFDAKQSERARETALDILDKQLPTLKRNAELKAKMEATQAGIGLELASALCHGKAFDLALRALKDTQLDDMVAKIEQVGQWLASTRFNQKAWENSPQLTAMRHQLEMYTAVAVEVIAGMPAGTLPKDDDLQKLARSVQDWLTAIAFHDVDEPEDVLSRYSVAGRYYAAMLGETQFASLLDAVALPKNAEYDHAKRIGGLAQLQLDLPWIKLSVPYWAGRLTELFDKEKPTLDKALVARLGKQVQDSYAASTKLGLEHPLFDRDLHLSALITALVGQDAKVLHERLAFVKAKDDKRLRDDTAQWLGDPARFLPLDWYQQVMQIWKDELNYQPKYYWIAWRAALNGAPKHALLVAAMAAKEFSKDASFTEEYEFMKKLFGEPAAPIAAPAQPAPPAPNAAKPAPPALGK